VSGMCACAGRTSTALAVEWTSEDLARIEAAVPRGAAAGDCYSADQMAMLDGERGAAFREHTRSY